MEDSDRTAMEESGINLARDLVMLSRRILNYAHKGFPRNEYFKRVTTLLSAFCGCNYIELRVLERGVLHRSGIAIDDPDSYYLERKKSRLDSRHRPTTVMTEDNDLENLCAEVYSGRYDGTPPYFSRNGSFRIGRIDKPFIIEGETRSVDIGEGTRSLAIIPFEVDGEKQGLMILKGDEADQFGGNTIELFEEIAQILGISFTYRRAQVALRERVKELTCLYGIAKVASQPGISLEDILGNAVELLPSGWLYPDVASARIMLDEGVYATDGFDSGVQKQSADIYGDGRKRGVVEIVYRKKKPDLDEGPFLKEERSLLNAVADEIALIVDRKEGEQEKERLRDQLRHADRLATIGQLAAGVAHELNEPLGSILGFAQLAMKSEGISEQTAKDIDKIERASLHAREIVRKLMIFSRQTPPEKENVDLSRLVGEGLYFLSARCRKAGIELVKKLDENLPTIVADRAQMYQVLVNLVVNAVQATPDGGRITISTVARSEHVSLIIEDNGSGMDGEVLKKIFIPFYTTKDVDEGTGLGLSVVHGIVASHGGFVLVESEVGKGSKFEVRLPINGKTEQSEKQNSKEKKDA